MAMVAVALATLGYAAIKSDQSLMKNELLFQGKRLDQVDQRMANFERVADRQTEILLLLAKERRIAVPEPRSAAAAIP